MNAEDLLTRLDGVRRTSRGWLARCVSHPDKSPSLSIREGERGLLIKCWAGCSVDEICTALGIRTSDLFFDARANPEAQRGRERARLERERQREIEGRRIDRLREADYLIQSAQGIDISQWSDTQLHDALNALAGAYSLLEKEEARYV